MAGNDADLSCSSCGLRIPVTFNAAETETYIVIVTGYQHSVGNFTLLVECQHSSYINDGFCNGVCGGGGTYTDDDFNDDYLGYDDY